jgi:hypothetical protein
MSTVMQPRRIITGLAVFALLALTHCSSQYQKYCDAVRDCEGGNDKDVDACVESQRATEEAAEEYDCGDQWQSVAECLDLATCKTVGTQRKIDTSSCSTGLAAVSACTKAASGRK